MRINDNIIALLQECRRKPNGVERFLLSRHEQRLAYRLTQEGLLESGTLDTKQGGRFYTISPAGSDLLERAGD